jgi:DEAD/DEAH box helicase domain-containing protein
MRELPQFGQSRRRVASALNMSDWRDFLKITLDFFVRAQGSISFPDEWRNWLGMPFAKSWLVDRDAETFGPRRRRWPRAKRSRYGTLVRLLGYIFQVDLENSLSQDRIDAVLLAAWNELIRIGLLNITADGFMLDYRGMAFAPMTRSWVCPVTRRFLDTTLRGVTPYLPRNATPATAECQPLSLPIYPKPFGGQVTDSLLQVEEARAWIEAHDVISKAREDGLWTGLNDRVIELSPYFVTAEHSAQQDSVQLDKYEKEFKRGDVNLLPCSTTMEMGIDVGGITVVAMNNVPPHPANYLQRAGRAGRRKESRSLSLTLCKANPHDQSVFSNSRWAFDTPLPAPTVSLNSSVIVQRHVNALALATFLAESISGQDLTKLTCDWFF